MKDRWDEVRALARQRPRSRLLRATAWSFVLATAGVWLSGEIEVGGFLSPRRLENLERFFTEEAVPFPLREEGFSWSGLGRWIAEVWRERGAEATWATLWIAVAAIVLAGTVALGLAPLAARNLTAREPFVVRGERRGPWRLVSGTSRAACVAARALPEYVLAFFLVAVLPGGAWPAVLALALHNGGILGRLYGDTVENLEVAPLRGLRMLGAGRRQLFLLAALPLALPRFLLYFFYRFETCVREATVLGMLGIASLGYEIREARARHFYDELLLLVGFGVGIVLAGELVSFLARGWIRRAR